MTGEYLSDVPHFLKDPLCCEKYSRANKPNSLHLTLKICLDICPLTFYLLLSSQFSSSFISENCLPLGADDVHGLTSKHVFAPNGGYFLYNQQLTTSRNLFVNFMMVLFMLKHDFTYCMLVDNEASLGNGKSNNIKSKQHAWPLIESWKMERRCDSLHKHAKK